MKKLIVLLPMLLMACVRPDSPAQAIFLAEGDYAAAVQAEVAYGNLPRCGKPDSPKVCSDVNIMKKLRKADDVAWAALTEAEIAVRTKGFGDSKITTTVATAVAFTKAFISITDTLEIK